MMSVIDYAQDVNKNVEEIFKLCKELNINVNTTDDMLDDEAITMLDNSLDKLDDEKMDDIVENMMETTNIKVDDSVKKQKLKKKADIIASKKDNIKNLKDKKKLMSNTSNVYSNFG